MSRPDNKEAARSALENLGLAWAETTSVLADLSPEDAKAALDESGWDASVATLLLADAQDNREQDQKEQEEA